MPPRYADAIIPPPEAIVVPTKRVACDGGGALGHPLVYMDMGGDDFVECAYCDRRFVLSAHPKPENEYLSPAARPPEAH
ncbi:zinc-finger domain-containing protein [Brevundimonas sp.]|uniref:zinc-finger domain-containing protein n=1 Tax=Brevundimonas sp. TaxID=1871086 RepID=UPI00272F61F7|nr:zinc-finger domain-containing protein [Brevundimonas sp.]MDP1912349.1 zinc-finger domain-containing protein [Brevundimonas sp.]